MRTVSLIYLRFEIVDVVDLIILFKGIYCNRIIMNLGKYYKCGFLKCDL